ncbi:MAG: SRPBCC family protein [Bacteroidia bacterium]|nr:SRPBCC family protein [Bacteroidia bacterium]
MQRFTAPFLLMLLLLAFTPSGFTQSGTRFSHTIQTDAAPARIWQLWADVPGWPAWDSGLREARLDGPFAAGAKGRLRPDRGPAARFVITALDPGRSYTFRSAIPFGGLYVKRTLSVQNGQTVFTHEVWFTGPLKGLFGRSLGARYQDLLPAVMHQLDQLARR